MGGLRLRSGFTIVELLVVVVVIAILASITIVTYNGITSRATEAAVKSDLKSAASALSLDYAKSGTYPDTVELANDGAGLKAGNDTTLTYYKEHSDYCLSAFNPRVGSPFYITGMSGQVREGGCSDIGSVWSSATIADGLWQGVAYNQGTFMAVASGSSVGPQYSARTATSRDGLTWSSLTTIPGLAYSVYIVPLIGSNGFLVKNHTGDYSGATTTNNGASWQQTTLTGTVSDYRGRATTYGNGKYVSVVATPPTTYSQTYTSSDGVNWTTHLTSVPWSSWYSVAYGNGKFVAVGNGTPNVMTSTDGINWTVQTAAANNAWRGITFADGKFVAVANNGTNRAMVSTDGVSWTLSNSTESSGWVAVTYGSGKFVAVANTGTKRVMTSSDGVSWTAYDGVGDAQWSDVTYGNGCFVAVAVNGTPRAMRSCW